MAVFIELVTDAFEEVFEGAVAARQNTDGGKASRAGKPLARRPVRGIEIKDDTYASMKVILSNGQEFPLLDSSSPDGYSKRGITNFILQQVQEQRMEKHQIVETFGDSYVFFFGESPRFLDCTAVLVNTLDFNWRAEWWHNYENYLRGTKLVELGARCYFFWDDNIIEGYMLNAAASEVSEAPYSVQLQFKFFVTKYQNVSLSNVERYPVRSSVQLPEGVELTNSDAFDRLQAYYHGAAAGQRGSEAASREQIRMSGIALRNERNKLSQKVRNLPAQMVVDPEVWNKLMGVRGFATPDQDFVAKKFTEPSGQIRGKIAQNIDEYVSGADIGSNYNSYLSYGKEKQRRGLLPDELAALGQQETEDLGRTVINILTALGADSDKPDSLRRLGLGPNFSPGWGANAAAFAGYGTGMGAYAGVGAGVGGSASFGVATSAGVSYNVVAAFGAGATAQARSGGFVSTSTEYQARDPLGQVYGRRQAQTDVFSVERRQYVEGGGDHEFGYWSAYGGVGYGVVGYADFGGQGYGGCHSQGDPGYLDPAQFSYRNTKEEQAAYDDWLRAKTDQTAVTRGSIYGSTNAVGGASIAVGGRSTAFAMVAMDGQLEPWVVEEAEASYEGDIGSVIQTRAAAKAQVFGVPGTFGAAASAEFSLLPDFGS